MDIPVIQLNFHFLKENHLYRLKLNQDQYNSAQPIIH